METLRLIRAVDGWYVNFEDTQEGTRMLAAFGMTTIPTGFGAEADYFVVRAEILARNPQYDVR